MPTINQLVRQGRQSSVKKSTAPALGKNKLRQSHLRSRIQLFVKSQEFV